MLALWLYLIEILHQTTTVTMVSIPLLSCILLKFYIKPQQLGRLPLWVYGCILLKFYIKPQLWEDIKEIQLVVSYWNSTSNHNFFDGAGRIADCCILLKFYIKPQLVINNIVWVISCILLKFYIKPQLACYYRCAMYGCILLKFYIKPQLK